MLQEVQASVCMNQATVTASQYYRLCKCAKHMLPVTLSCKRTVNIIPFKTWYCQNRFKHIKMS